nr:MAG TPA: hypothetical protein [Caudoviricetes sp.]
MDPITDIIIIITFHITRLFFCFQAIGISL